MCSSKNWSGEGEILEKIKPDVDSTKIGKRIVVREPRKAIEAKLVPELESMAADIKTLISLEITKHLMKAKNSSTTLDIKDTMSIRNLTEAYVKLNKESREAAKSEDLSSLSHEEVIELAKKIVRKEL